MSNGYSSLTTKRLFIGLYFLNLLIYLLVNVFNNDLSGLNLILLVIHTVLLLRILNLAGEFHSGKNKLDERQTWQRLRAHSQAWTILATATILVSFAVHLALDAQIPLPVWDTETVVAFLFVSGMTIMMLPYTLLFFNEPKPLPEE